MVGTAGRHRGHNLVARVMLALAVIAAACGGDSEVAEEPKPQPVGAEQPADELADESGPAREPSDAAPTEPSRTEPEGTEPAVEELAATGSDRPAIVLPDPQPLLDAWADRHGVPGAVALISDGTTERFASSGTRSVDSAVLVTTDDQFGIGSVAKTYAATTVMALVDEGTLTLDARVADYIPGTPLDLQLEQLLNHTSGFVDGDLRDQLVAALFDRSQRLTTTEQLEAALAVGPARAAGTQHEYAVINYVMVDLLVEAATGRSFEAELQRLVLDPLGLSATGFTPTGDLAAPHDRPGPGQAPLDFSAFEVGDMIRGAGASGGLYSTAADVDAFTRGLFGGQLLSAESLERMVTPTADPEYALGISTYAAGDGVVFGHNGRIVGYHASFRFDPETGLSVVVLANSGDAPTDELAARLVSTAGLR